MSGFQGRGSGPRGGAPGRGGGRDYAPRGGGGGRDFRGGGGRDMRGGGGRDFRGGGGRDFGRGGGSRGGGRGGPVESSSVQVPVAPMAPAKALPRRSALQVSLRDTPAEDIPFPPRPSYASAGVPVRLTCNHYSAAYKHQAVVDQYDVALEGVGVMDIPSKKLRSIIRAFEEQHSAALGSAHVAFDGRSILYAAPPLPFQEETFTVQLQPAIEGGRTSEYKVKIMHTAERKLSDIEDYLQSRRPDHPSDCINALDVVLRTMPSRSLVAAGRNFYTPQHDQPISGGAEVWIGYYQTLRLSQIGTTFIADMAASAFLREQPLLQYVCEVLMVRQPRDISRGLSPQQAKTLEKALRTVAVQVLHRPSTKRYKINGLTRLPAATQRIPQEDGSEGPTVAAYFAQKYRPLEYPGLPCLRVGAAEKHNYLPMEVCKIAPGQRVMKLGDMQTADMIKVACRRPDVRRGLVHTMIEPMRAAINQHADPFGVQIQGSTVSMQGRVLPPPQIQYGGKGASTVEAPRNGTWNMANKQFFQGKAMECWAVVSFCDPSPRGMPRGALEQFVGQFCRVARDHGMTTPMTNPPIYLMAEHRSSPEQVMKMAATEAIKQAKAKKCQYVLIIKPDKNIQDYAEIKLVGDTRMGVPTQCMIMKHARDQKVQVLANILLKVNAKLGGRNAVPKAPYTGGPTIVFGADVHHPAPGLQTRPSIAAVVASLDKFFARHAAVVRAQAHRKETITDLSGIVQQLLRVFYRNAGVKPANIIFLRDGVSEGQFRTVLKEEVRAIEEACRALESDYRPKITFITCQKRHHTRLFALDAKDMDRSGNVPAGTVVDTAICHPSEFDFFLCSHSGLQGTSKPTKYSVLWDEIGFDANSLQKLLFEMCFMQARCTRSVSIPPAVYYAHLCAFRAQHFLSDDFSETASSVSGATAPSAAAADARSINWAEHFSAVHANLDDVMYFI